MGQYDAVTRIQSISEDRLSVDVLILGTPHIQERSYLLDGNLQVVHLAIPQPFKARHREFFQQGKIDHEFSDSEREKMMQFYR